jgi:hypothetical protein
MKKFNQVYIVADSIDLDTFQVREMVDPAGHKPGAFVFQGPDDGPVSFAADQFK